MRTPGVSNHPLRVSVFGGAGAGKRALVAGLLRATEPGGGGLVVSVIPSPAHLRDVIAGGASTADLAAETHGCADPLQFAERSSSCQRLFEGFRRDMELARQLAPVDPRIRDTSARDLGWLEALRSCTWRATRWRSSRAR